MTSREAGLTAVLLLSRNTPEVLKVYTTAFNPIFLGLRGNLQRTTKTDNSWLVSRPRNF
jgi:hypothetical protein